MKKCLLLCALAVIFFSCDKKQDEPEIVKNSYANTKWTASDDIAELIYGKTCTTTIEFFEDYTCQELNKRVGMKFGAGTFVESGTYRLKNDSVYWTVGTSTIGGIAKGSALSTNMGTVAGGKRIYTKE